ncbi:hypothetical protein NC653_037535 [Populus alba x Populus x berolinensis]|uniref:Uncharacterized protein n=1 Tax=Populus alba x Populus x berolinensis TaxID=444605 RepID=A0AAD6PS71_9ROSI|nr:hypothetical protein NC653_037535 [Populus alba x Populus x berolinensis]
MSGPRFPHDPVQFKLAPWPARKTMKKKNKNVTISDE